MDIITAIKSGKPFRRKEWGDKMDYIRLPEKGFNRLELSVGDILATDWIIEEPKVEITESEFDKAVKESMAEIYRIEIKGQWVVRMEPGVFEKAKARLFGKK